MSPIEQKPVIGSTTIGSVKREAQTGSQASSRDALQEILNDMRRRFADTFVAQCDSMSILLGRVAALGTRGPVGVLTQITHQPTSF